MEIIRRTVTSTRRAWVLLPMLVLVLMFTQAGCSVLLKWEGDPASETCYNGVVDGEDECEEGDLQGRTCENLGLTGHHAEVILSAGVGEGILVVESKPYHVFFQASRSEVGMLTPYDAHSSPATPDLLTRR